MNEIVKERNKKYMKKLNIYSVLYRVRSKYVVNIIKRYTLPEIVINIDDKYEEFYERIYGINQLHYCQFKNDRILGNMIQKTIYKNGKMKLGKYYYYYYKSTSILKENKSNIEECINEKSLYKLIKYGENNGKNNILYTKIYCSPFISKSLGLKRKVKEKYSFDEDNLLHGEHYEYNQNTNENILTVYNHGIPINTNIY